MNEQRQLIIQRGPIQYGLNHPREYSQVLFRFLEVVLQMYITE